MKKNFKDFAMFAGLFFMTMFLVLVVLTQDSYVMANETNSELNLQELSPEEAQAFLDLTKTMSEDLATTNKSLSYSVLMMEASNKQSSGDFVGAIEIYTKIVDTDPKNIAAYLERGNAKIRFNQEEEGKKDINLALLIVNQGLEQNPNDAKLYHSRGQANQYLKNYDQAMLDVQKAIELDPNDISYPITLQTITMESKLKNILK